MRGGCSESNRANNAFDRVIVVLAFIIPLLAGCASVDTQDKVEGQRQYSYRPPVIVKDDDQMECSERARSKATAALSGEEFKTEDTFGRLFGFVGALIAVGAAIAHGNMITESAYETEMKACLKEKGYSIPD